MYTIEELQDNLNKFIILSSKWERIQRLVDDLIKREAEFDILKNIVNCMQVHLTKQMIPIIKTINEYQVFDETHKIRVHIVIYKTEKDDEILPMKEIINEYEMNDTMELIKENVKTILEQRTNELNEQRSEYETIYVIGMHMIL